MTDWIIVPTVLPAMTAALLVLAMRNSLAAQRAISIAATAALLAVAIGLYGLAADGVVRPYFVGNWPAPFGIVLVLDRLSATMLMLTAALALVVVLYAAAGWDTRGRHFHMLFQFQLLGINGAFLTGDVFNLFVFFEVMLIASYGLMLHGGGATRLKAGFQYVAINLVASTLFLFAVGLIYAVTGTLNMADLAVKAAAVAPADAALLKTGALLLFLVFAVKAALVPLHWWLPGTYAATSAPSAALFMIMTKVGAYAILRVHGQMFGAGDGAVSQAASALVMPAALVTLAAGAVGMLAARRLRDLICFAVVASMGTLLVAVAAFDIGGTTAALYYLVHSTLAGAALFLLADLVADRRGAWLDRLVPADALPRTMLFAALFFLAAIAMAGMPPLSGFIGKLMILDATRGAPGWATVWTVVLVASLLMIVAFGRAGSTLFWKTGGMSTVDRGSERRALLPLAMVGALLAGMAAMTAGAGPVAGALEATARQALDSEGYVRAVLGPDARIRVAGGQP
ncbi:MAG: monovalent cation/H+ antiporter subunit D [Rhodospirillales bacterium]